MLVTRVKASFCLGTRLDWGLGTGSEPSPLSGWLCHLHLASYCPAAGTVMIMVTARKGPARAVNFMMAALGVPPWQEGTDRVPELCSQNVPTLLKNQTHAGRRTE